MTNAASSAGVSSSSSARLLACIDGQAPDIGTLWEVCAHFEWPDRQAAVDGIAAWLGPSGGLRILDCACGSGFPAIDLARLGYDIVCSDGSAVMLEHFRRNASRDGIAVEPSLLTWEELTCHYVQAFDVVMCRGGASFLYAGGWDVDAPPQRETVTSAVGQFVACVRPGGRLYVDMIPADSLAGREPKRTTYPPLNVGGHRVELEETLTNDPDKGIRIWRARLTIDGAHHEFKRRSHYLRQDELLDILGAAGLTDVRQEAVPGERYDVFTGKRPS